MGTVAVTGAASGIGAATRELLLRAGHRVIGIDLAEADVLADLATATGRQAAIDAVLAHCGGRLDGVVTAAGVPPRAPAAQIVSVNFFGTVRLLSGLRSALTAADHGRAVALSSVYASTIPGVPIPLVEACLADDEVAALEFVAGAQPAEHVFIYAATKVAIARWVRRHAPTSEWARAGIRLNAIAPGATNTPFFGETFLQQMAEERLPTGVAAEPEQVAAWIVAMLGPDAEFMCGSVVYLDGGTDAARNPDAWPMPPAGPLGANPRPSWLRGLRRRR